jgi:hypothetical protein
MFIATRKDSGAALEWVSVPEQPGKECRFLAIYCQLRRHEFIPLPCPWEMEDYAQYGGYALRDEKCGEGNFDPTITALCRWPTDSRALSHGSKISQREAELGGLRGTARMTPERREKRIVQLFVAIPGLSRPRPASRDKRRLITQRLRSANHEEKLVSVQCRRCRRPCSILRPRAVEHGDCGHPFR